MNTSNIKRYAPQARKNFIAAITKQAAKYGISESSIEPIEQKGDLALIGERPFPASIIKPRAALVQKIKQQGFTQVIEQVAYSWFNRLCAIRYMELKDYLEHGRRVLSHPDQTGSFQILDDCLDIELAGLDKTKVRALKLDGTQDELLYRELLLAQCHALHKAMPFLFEAVDDETELLLPENLTKTDSLIHELVNEIPEEDWQSVEIIGWLYQFYISEKKDEVIGKVVKSEDIPAATQLFTPNWIVKYMVQNSLGAQWLATYPESPLKAHMEYYITPAQQTDEVNAQLNAITPSALNPEELTLIDPACGSGHILVEAYDLFKAIYLERGYRQRDIAQLILEKNLFGLDIDTRAAQLTGFALMMKGRDDDRRLFERDIKLNVMAMVDSTGFDVDALTPLLRHSQDASRHSREGGNPAFDIDVSDLIELKNLFEHATTFGSLIQVPSVLKEKLPALKQLSELKSDDLFVKESLENLQVLVQQAELLAQQYDSVVANPPFMGGKYLNSTVKNYLKQYFEEYNKDLFAAFIFRNFSLTKECGVNAYVTPFVWMFLSSYQTLRETIFNNYSIGSLVKPSYTSFFESAIVPLVTFVVEKRSNNFKGTFFDLGYLGSAESQPIKLKNGIVDSGCDYRHISSSKDFKKIPGSPVAYWVSERIRRIFEIGSPLETLAPVRQGMATGNNDLYLRVWSEVSISKSNFNAKTKEEAFFSGARWFPYNKGGGYRKWNGNKEFLISFDRDSYEILKTVGNHCPSENYYFLPAVTWSFISSSYFGVRQSEAGFVFDVAGSSCFPPKELMGTVAAFLCSKLPTVFLAATNPTLNFQAGNIRSLPIIDTVKNLNVSEISESAVRIAKNDWDSFERSWFFKGIPLLIKENSKNINIYDDYNDWLNYN